MRLSNAIDMFNQTFNTTHGRTCVIALWTHEWLRSFTDDELNELADNATAERMYSDREFQTTINRLLARIKDVKAERVRGHNTDTQTKDDSSRQMEAASNSDEVLGIQGRAERMGKQGGVQVGGRVVDNIPYPNGSVMV